MEEELAELFVEDFDFVKTVLVELENILGSLSLVGRNVFRSVS